jgi:hypothetical protein
MNKMIASIFGRPKAYSNSSDSSEPITPPAKRFNLDTSRKLDLAGLLIKKSTLSKIFPEYASRLKMIVADELTAAGGFPDSHTDQELLSMSSHPCVTAWVQRALAEYDGRMNKTPESETSTLQGIAIVLAHGFDKVQEPNPKKRPFFKRDQTGKIVGILNTEPGMPNARFKDCDMALKGIPLLGGKRHKTLKSKHLKRKTLRRRKSN